MNKLKEIIKSRLKAVLEVHNLKEHISKLSVQQECLQAVVSNLSKQNSALEEKLNFYENHINSRKILSLAAYFQEELRKLDCKNTEKKYIFITARYRTGSTYLYSLFASIQNTNSFLEPLHPHLLETEAREDKWHKQQRELLSHTISNNYFEEYKALDRSILSLLHKKDFSTKNIIMTSEDIFNELKEYLLFLISSNIEQLNVFQFNRVDFRLGWLKANFPNALILNLRRNPRDIFASYCKVSQKANLPEGSGFDCLFGDRDQINAISRRLRPQLAIQELNEYEKIYILNRLSNLWSDSLADMIIDYEELVAAPYKILEKITAKIAGVTLKIEDKKIIKPKNNTFGLWKEYNTDSWFKQSELKCERLIEKIIA
ncbi:sulfotransferase [Coleofasciculus sp. FACHB-64]|uniref:sulfotransferase n=1 Tax=Cyanophyceae TaxID=3028117 RepID=UPI001689D63F|nr:sulfotransferase [Coleofasciculus sp. FACHB-64]MBD2045369.1 sulfotransferase [Coleofasciculus sp. FACHB-64]